jgi:hypothetical protein
MQHLSRRSQHREHGQVSAVAAIAIGVVAFVAGLASGFAGGFTAAGTSQAKPTAVDEPLPGEFRLGPGNLTPPGIVVPLE